MTAAPGPGRPGSGDPRLALVVGGQGPLAPLASLDVRHGHFDGGVCRALEVRPAPGTVERLKLLGLRVRMRGDGVDVLAAEGAPRRGPAAPLLFTMALRDTRFALYTDMPSDLLPGDPPLRFEGGREGGVLIAPDWPAAAAAGRAEAGRAAAAPPFGLFALHLPPEGAAPARHELRFGARRTVWRYIVAARRGALAGGDLEVVGAGGAAPEPGFDRVADRRLPDGRIGVVFASRSPLPLRQRPERRFALRGPPLGGDARPRALVDPLPAAAPRSTVFDPGAPARAWSDIYVFV